MIWDWTKQSASSPLSSLVSVKLIKLIIISWWTASYKRPEMEVNEWALAARRRYLEEYQIHSICLVHDCQLLRKKEIVPRYHPLLGLQSCSLEWPNTKISQQQHLPEPRTCTVIFFEDVARLHSSPATDAAISVGQCLSTCAENLASGFCQHQSPPYLHFSALSTANKQSDFTWWRGNDWK